MPRQQALMRRAQRLKHPGSDHLAHTEPGRARRVAGVVAAATEAVARAPLVDEVHREVQVDRPPWIHSSSAGSRRGPRQPPSTTPAPQRRPSWCRAARRRRAARCRGSGGSPPPSPAGSRRRPGRRRQRRGRGPSPGWPPEALATRGVDHARPSQRSSAMIQSGTAGPPCPGLRIASTVWSGAWTRTEQARLPAPSSMRGVDDATFISTPVLGRGAARVAIGSRPAGPSTT